MYKFEDVFSHFSAAIICLDTIKGGLKYFAAFAITAG
jgi:hypothetical protein